MVVLLCHLAGLDTDPPEAVVTTVAGRQGHVPPRRRDRYASGGVFGQHLGEFMKIGPRYALDVREAEPSRVALGYF